MIGQLASSYYDIKSTITSSTYYQRWRRKPHMNLQSSQLKQTCAYDTKKNY